MVDDGDFYWCWVVVGGLVFCVVYYCVVVVDFCDWFLGLDGYYVWVYVVVDDY